MSPVESEQRLPGRGSALLTRQRVSSLLEPRSFSIGETGPTPRPPGERDRPSEGRTGAGAPPAGGHCPEPARQAIGRKVTAAATQQTGAVPPRARAAGPATRSSRFPKRLAPGSAGRGAGRRRERGPIVPDSRGTCAGSWGGLAPRPPSPSGPSLTPGRCAAAGGPSGPAETVPSSLFGGTPGRRPGVPYPVRAGDAGARPRRPRRRAGRDAELSGHPGGALRGRPIARMRRRGPRGPRCPPERGVSEPGSRRRHTRQLWGRARQARPPTSRRSPPGPLAGRGLGGAQGRRRRARGGLTSRRWWVPAAPARRRLLCRPRPARC